MRRLLLILLLTIFPLQASWAVVCAYCPAQCVVEAEQAVGDNADDAAASLGLDSDCQCCQLGGVGIAATLSSPDTAAPQATFVASGGVTFLTILRPQRPERPKWPRAA